MATPETHEESVIKLAESSDLPSWALTSLKRYLRRALNTAAAGELDRQASHLERRVNSHGLGYPHGVFVPCPRCEAWRSVVALLRARAVELRSAE